MEEFEKQWKNTACHVEAGCGDQSCSECKLIAAHWYRAALEWVQEIGKDNTLHDAGINIWEEIYKELEN